MCDWTSQVGLHRWMAKPATTTSTRRTQTQVITLSEVGARSRRRALATARLLFLMS